MTRPVQYEQDVLEGMAADPTPRMVDDRAEIAKAITAAAADRRGLVHAAGIRRHLPASVNPAYIGVVVNLLRSRGALVFTSRYEANGNTASRNGSKPSPVWRLIRAIEEGDLT